MKKKLLLVVPICAALLAGAFAISIYAAEASKNPDSKSSADVNSKVSDINDQTAVSIDFSEEIQRLAKRYKDHGKVLTGEQLQKINELYDNQNMNPDLCSLGYQEGVIVGEIDPNAPKLDLATAKKIIAEHNDFEEILSEFDKVQKAPDLIGGSGVAFWQYWLNEEGSEIITVIYQQQDIFYGVVNPDGTYIARGSLF